MRRRKESTLSYKDKQIDNEIKALYGNEEIWQAKWDDSIKPMRLPTHITSCADWFLVKFIANSLPIQGQCDKEAATVGHSLHPAMKLDLCRGQPGKLARGGTTTRTGVKTGSDHTWD